MVVSNIYCIALFLFVCLRLVSSVPSVASFSGLSMYSPFCFSCVYLKIKVLFQEDKKVSEIGKERLNSDGRSTVPIISKTNKHLSHQLIEQKRPQHMSLEIQLLGYDRREKSRRVKTASSATKQNVTNISQINVTYLSLCVLQMYITEPPFYLNWLLFVNLFSLLINIPEILLTGS